MRLMTIARTITAEAEWDALPVGTLARVGYIDHDDDGNEIDGGIAFVIRVDGDIQANVGDYWLCGGKWWLDVWRWEQGVTVADLHALLPEPEWPGTPPKAASTEASTSVIVQNLRDYAAALNALEKVSTKELLARPAGSGTGPSTARRIMDDLTELGWTPPSV